MMYLCDQHHLQQQEHAGPAQGAVQPPSVERVQMRHLWGQIQGVFMFYGYCTNSTLSSVPSLECNWMPSHNACNITGITKVVTQRKARINSFQIQNPLCIEARTPLLLPTPGIYILKI